MNGLNWYRGDPVREASCEKGCFNLFIVQKYPKCGLRSRTEFVLRAGAAYWISISYKLGVALSLDNALVRD